MDNILEVGMRLTAEEMAMIGDIGLTEVDSEGGGVIDRSPVPGCGLQRLVPCCKLEENKRLDIY